MFSLKLVWYRHIISTYYRHMDKVVNEWIKHMQQMSKRYETNNGCKMARTKWTFKTRRRTKTNLYSTTIKSYIDT